MLGRDILTDMSITFDKLLKQSLVKAISLEQSAIEEVVTDHSDLFEKGLGLLQGIEAEVAVEQAATPRFHKCRPVPFAL